MRAAVSGWSPVIITGTDAGAMRFCHGITHFRTRRIDDADHADPNQIILKHSALFRNIGNMTRGVQHDS